MSELLKSSLRLWKERKKDLSQREKYLVVRVIENILNSFWHAVSYQVTNDVSVIQINIQVHTKLHKTCSILHHNYAEIYKK